MLHFGLLVLTLLGSGVLGLRDPYSRIEAESLDDKKGGIYKKPNYRIASDWVDDLFPGDFLLYRQLDFSAETIAFQMHFGCYGCVGFPNRKVLLRLDSPTSVPFLSYGIHTTGDHWLVVTQLIPREQRPRGVHDLYITFASPLTDSVCGIDWFTFVAAEAQPPKFERLVEPVDCCSASQLLKCPKPRLDKLNNYMAGKPLPLLRKSSISINLAVDAEI